MQNQEREKQDEAEWLNLRVQMSKISSPSEAETRPPPPPPPINKSNKILVLFSCNFCRCKFYSSQALGGHQNAHRRERGLVRHYQYSQNMIMSRSLGLQTHSNIHKSPRLINGSTAARYSERNTSFGLMGQEAADVNFMWPGSFRFGHDQLHSEDNNLSNPDILDLNLKL